jgi:hypothetical protein
MRWTGLLSLVFAVVTSSLVRNPVAIASTVKTTQFTCAAFYLPTRSIWNRRVDIRYQDSRVLAVKIDGLPVYAFSLDGHVILTAIDNERIQIDTQAMLWASDFRGMATSQGQCIEPLGQAKQ